MSAAIDGTSEPRWIRDGVRASQGELRAFLSTGYRFARHPYRFGRAWVEGKERALNPAAMLATAVGFAVAARVGVMALEKSSADNGNGIVDQVLDSVGPHLHYAFLGLLAHCVMRLVGSKRRLASSVGIAMFAGAGPAWFAGMLSMVLHLLQGLAARPPPTGTVTTFSQLSPWQILSIGMSVAAFVAFLATLCAGLTGAHGRRWIWSVLAVTIAVGISGLFFGAFPLAPGRYGPHLAIGTGMALGGTVTRGVDLLP